MNELAISLSNDGKKHLYEQIYEYLKKEIQQGTLTCFEKLPATRALATYLQVSRSTVDLAYDQLLSEGYIEVIPYKGYYVSKIDGICHIDSTQQQEEREQAVVQTKYEVDFSPNGIDLDSFPHHTWQKITKRVLLERGGDIFQLGEQAGERCLREAISKYLHQARGVQCKAKQVIIGAGNDYLLFLVGKLLGEGRIIAMENPTYKHAYMILESYGHTMITVHTDEAGFGVKELQGTRANLAYVMPSHQHPLGTVMPIKRRMNLLQWADEAENRYIIEDDYDSEFRYKGRPIPALQGFDKKGKVIYMGTFSKSIAPAIRVSYMVLPEQLLHVYEKVCKMYSSTVSRVDQEVIAIFLREGYFERHLNRMRTIYKSKHDTLMSAMKHLETICKVYGENAGIHILVKFHNGLTEEEAIQRAADQKIRVYGLSQYDVRKTNRRHQSIIMGYANLKEEDIIHSVRKLAEVWKNPVIQ